MNEAQETIYNCYNRLQEIGVLTLKEKPTVVTDVKCNGKEVTKMQKAKKVLNHFGYNESQFDISDVYTGHRKKTVNEIFEKIALANLLESDKKVRVTIEYDPNYEDFLILVTDT